MIFRCVLKILKLNELHILFIHELHFYKIIFQNIIFTSPNNFHASYLPSMAAFQSIVNTLAQYFNSNFNL